MQFVIVSPSLGKVHGFIRQGEATKFDYLVRSSLNISELWFLTEPRRPGANSTSYWTLIWRRGLVKGELDLFSHEIRPLSSFT
jgi:hypothetical protein